MFEIVFTDKSLKQLQKFERDVKERIINSLERIRTRPEVHLLRLVGQQGYRLRVGDYRIIIDLDYVKSSIVIIKVGHRKEIYD